MLPKSFSILEICWRLTRQSKTPISSELKTKSTNILVTKTSWRCSSLRSSGKSCKRENHRCIHRWQAVQIIRIHRCINPRLSRASPLLWEWIMFNLIISCKTSQRSRTWRVKRAKEEVLTWCIHTGSNWRGRVRYSSIERGFKTISRRNNKR